MGYGIVPPKGEPTICEGECNHRDCAAWHKFFDTPCPICKKPLEPGQKFFFVSRGTHLGEHALCVWEREGVL